MKLAPWMKVTKREFYADRRKALKRLRSDLDDLRTGCAAMRDANWQTEIHEIEKCADSIYQKLRGIR